MSTKTKFIFDAIGNGTLQIKQRKFSVKEYQVENFSTIEYEGFTSWSQPCSFDFLINGHIVLKNFRFSINSVESGDYVIIKQSVGENLLPIVDRKFLPMIIDNDSAFLRVLTKIINKHPL